MSADKQPFVSTDDRPKVGMDPDTPISELRVRDLALLLRGADDLKLYEGEIIISYKDVQDSIQKLSHDYVYKYVKDHTYKTTPVKEFEYRFDQVVATVSGLQQQVGSLVREVDALKRGSNAT